MNDIYQNQTINQQIESEKVNALKIERIDSENEILVYIKGTPFPIKGMPTIEALAAINTIKRIVLESIKTFKVFLLFVNKKQAISSFNRISQSIISEHIFKKNHQQPFTKAISQIIYEVLMNFKIDIDISVKVSETLAHIFEYDNAYRIRIQDLLSETTQERLITRPIKEIQKLKKLNKERDYKYVSKSVSLIVNLLSVILLIPKYRKLFKQVIKQSNFKDLQFDEADRYWVSLREDYLFFGQSYKERIQHLKEQGYNLPTYE